jgi:hypothetical protein
MDGTNEAFRRSYVHKGAKAKMRDHIKILGLLNIIMGSLTALIGLTALLVMGGIAGLMASGVADSSLSDVENARTFAPWLGLIGLVAAIFFSVIALPTIIGGWGLLRYKSWSRVLTIIVSAFHLLSLPFGTALGIYGRWVLTNDQSRQLLDSGGTLPPQTFPMRQQPVGHPPQTV